MLAQQARGLVCLVYPVYLVCLVYLVSPQSMRVRDWRESRDVRLNYPVFLIG